MAERVILRAVTGDTRSFMAPGELGYAQDTGELVLAGFGGAPAAARVAPARTIAYIELAGAPTPDDIPAGRAAVVRDILDGSVRLYFNDDGKLKSVVLA